MKKSKTRVKCILLAVMMCCKNRFDQCTLYICFALDIFLTHFVPRDTIDYRAVGASQPKKTQAGCEYSNILTSSMKAIF